MNHSPEYRANIIMLVIPQFEEEIVGHNMFGQIVREAPWKQVLRERIVRELKKQDEATALIEGVSK